MHKQDPEVLSNVYMGVSPDTNGLEKKALGTIIQYNKLAERLTARARMAFDIDTPEVDPRTVVAYLVELMPMIKARTFRLYRAALVHHFEEIATPESLSARDYLKEDVGGGSDFENEVGIEVNESRTSSMKAKRLTNEDLEAIIQELKRSKSKWAGATGVWLKAGLMTGLRPIEWIGAVVHDEVGVPFIRARNAKNTHGRSHGDTRDIFLNGISDRNLLLIKRHIEVIQLYQENGLYMQFYNSCQRVLHHAVRRIFPDRRKHVTLYTSRHQFAADAKSTYSKVEVAALMGHASDDTARKFYGIAAHGSGNMQFSPGEDNVEAVKRLNEGDYLHGDITLDDFLTA